MLLKGLVFGVLLAVASVTTAHANSNIRYPGPSLGLSIGNGIDVRVGPGIIGHHYLGNRINSQRINRGNNRGYSNRYLGKRHTSKQHLGKRHTNKRHLGKRHTNKQHLGKRYTNKQHLGKKHLSKQYLSNRYKAKRLRSSSTNKGQYNSGRRILGGSQAGGLHWYR